MGFIFSILYLFIYYLTPVYLFGPLADWHIEVIIAALAIITSVPALMRSFLFKNLQSLAIVGMAIAVFLSFLFGVHWIGGGEKALLNFIPNGMAYFLICLNCTSKKRLQILVLILFCVCLFVIGNGCYDLARGVPENAPPPGVALGGPVTTGATASPFLLRQMTDAESSTLRLMGLGEINDPNDFGQLIVCVIPLVFIFWRRKKLLSNVFFVFVPVSILLFGVFLTHSRGALIALTAVAIVAARRRIGLMPALGMAALLFVAAMALHFTGGRDISASAGEDRTALWGQGMQVIKTHPLFGVGFGNLGDYTDAHLTAHNSIIVCAAELGIFGLYFWCLFLLTSARDALLIASPGRVSDPVLIESKEDPFKPSPWKTVTVDKSDIIQLGKLMVLSLTGFLVAGWFLSRAWVMTFFLLGGMVEAIYQMALQRGMIAPRMLLPRALAYAFGLVIALLIIMYIVIRVLNVIR